MVLNIRILPQLIPTLMDQITFAFLLALGLSACNLVWSCLHIFGPFLWDLHCGKFHKQVHKTLPLPEISITSGDHTTHVKSIHNYDGTKPKQVMIAVSSHQQDLDPHLSTQNTQEKTISHTIRNHSSLCIGT